MRSQLEQPEGGMGLWAQSSAPGAGLGPDERSSHLSQSWCPRIRAGTAAAELWRRSCSSPRFSIRGCPESRQEKGKRSPSKKASPQQLEMGNFCLKPTGLLPALCSPSPAAAAVTPRSLEPQLSFNGATEHPPFVIPARPCL